MSAVGAARRRRHGDHGGHEEENAERWLLTYADMITLLLALFVVLFAMSSISVKKFLEFKMGLTQAFNPSALTQSGSKGLLQQTSLVQQATSPQASQIGPPIASSAAATARQAQLQKIAQQVSAALDRQHLQSAASVQTTRKGVVVQVLAERLA